MADGKACSSSLTGMTKRPRSHDDSPGPGPRPRRWARIVCANTMTTKIEIVDSEIAIDLAVLGVDLKGKQCCCKIYKDASLGVVKLQNCSGHDITVKGEVLKVNDDIIIESGSEIVFGPKNTGCPVYLIFLSEDFNVKDDKFLGIIENMKCSICLNAWHDVVTVAPCLHNFCNACFSRWYKRLMVKGYDFTCPQCRSKMYSVGRNHSLQNIVEGLVKLDPTMQKLFQNNVQLDKISLVKSDTIIIGRNAVDEISEGHMMENDSYETSDSESAIICPQCEVPQDNFGEFRCQSDTPHLQCQSCWGFMPLRNDIHVPQECVGCRKVQCGTYWHSQNITINLLAATCGSSALIPISERTFSTMPGRTHAGNIYEQDITKRCINGKGKTMSDVIHEYCLKLNTGEIGRLEIPTYPEQQITSESPLCYSCSDIVAAQILQYFRLQIPRSELPPDVAEREDCWWGYRCRTQHHNHEHAQKKNHVCEPTRRAR